MDTGYCNVMGGAITMDGVTIVNLSSLAQGAVSEDSKAAMEMLFE